MGAYVLVGFLFFCRVARSLRTGERCRSRRQIPGPMHCSKRLSTCCSTRLLSAAGVFDWLSVDFESPENRSMH